MSLVIETPKLTVDVIVRIWDQRKLRGIALIERKNFPEGLAIPGGFVDEGETVEQAAVREMKEELTLEVRLARLQGVYSKPDRDPRFHTVSVVFVADADGTPRGASDAQTALIVPLEEIPFEQLVFDHAQIIEDFLRIRTVNPAL